MNITYSAEEQKELNVIRARYAPKENRPLTNLEKAKAIDARVERKGLIRWFRVFSSAWQAWRELPGLT